MTNQFFTASFLNHLKIKKMAKQKGIIKLEGTIGDITFQKTRDGYLAREKGGVSAGRIANDPAFQRTRENGAEFGRAGNAGKALRNALRQLLQNASDRRVVSRLTRAMMAVIQTDAVNARGERTVTQGELDFLQGFDFNINGKLSTTLFAGFIATINRVAGTAEIALAPFVPSVMIAAPGGTTHFRIFGAGAEVDFDLGTSVSQVSDSGILPWDNVATTSITLSHTLTANSTHPLFAVLGIEFLQEVNGVQYRLKNGAFNAMAIVKVSAV
jgi:hypothetical protein